MSRWLKRAGLWVLPHQAAAAWLASAQRRDNHWIPASFTSTSPAYLYGLYVSLEPLVLLLEATYPGAGPQIDRLRLLIYRQLIVAPFIKKLRPWTVMASVHASLTAMVSLDFHPQRAAYVMRWLDLFTAFVHTNQRDRVLLKQTVRLCMRLLASLQNQRTPGKPGDPWIGGLDPAWQTTQERELVYWLLTKMHNSPLGERPKVGDVSGMRTEQIMEHTTTSGPPELPDSIRADMRRNAEYDLRACFKRALGLEHTTIDLADSLRWVVDSGESPFFLLSDHDKADVLQTVLADIKPVELKRLLPSIGWMLDRYHVDLANQHQLSQTQQADPLLQAFADIFGAGDLSWQEMLQDGATAAAQAIDSRPTADVLAVLDLLTRTELGSRGSAMPGAQVVRSVWRAVPAMAKAKLEPELATPAWAKLNRILTAPARGTVRGPHPDFPEAVTQARQFVASMTPGDPGKDFITDLCPPGIQGELAPDGMSFKYPFPANRVELGKFLSRHFHVDLEFEGAVLALQMLWPELAASHAAQTHPHLVRWLRDGLEMIVWKRAHPRDEQEAEFHTLIQQWKARAPRAGMQLTFKEIKSAEYAAEYPKVFRLTAHAIENTLSLSEVWRQHSRLAHGTPNPVLQSLGWNTSVKSDLLEGLLFWVVGAYQELKTPAHVKAANAAKALAERGLPYGELVFDPVESRFLRRWWNCMVLRLPPEEPIQNQRVK